MPATKQRSCRLVHEDGLDILVIREVKDRKEQTDYYRLERNRNAPAAFRLHKMVHSDEDEKVYDVLLDGDASHCDCIGFDQYGYCRHVESLLAIEAGEKLPK